MKSRLNENDDFSTTFDTELSQSRKNHQLHRRRRHYGCQGCHGLICFLFSPFPGQAIKIDYQT